MKNRPPILYAHVRSRGKEALYLGPARAELSHEREELRVLVGAPRLRAQLRREVVDVALAALPRAAAGNRARNDLPTPPIRSHQRAEEAVLGGSELAVRTGYLGHVQNVADAESVAPVTVCEWRFGCISTISVYL